MKSGMLELEITSVKILTNIIEIKKLSGLIPDSLLMLNFYTSKFQHEPMSSK